MPDNDSLNERIQKARVKVSGTIRERADLMMEEREACNKRGYHRVEQEPKNPNSEDLFDARNLMICYDCEVWFGFYDNITYSVERL